MAVDQHIAHMAFVAVNTVTGQVLSKDDKTLPINVFLHTEHQWRVIPDPSLPNTANWPTLDTYLQSELPFSLSKISQSMIITSNLGSASMVNVAYLQLSNVDPLGRVVNKNDPRTTIADMLHTQLAYRIIPNSNIPNSVGGPSLDQYLAAEFANGFTVSHIDQSMIITSNVSYGGATGLMGATGVHG